MKAKKGITGAPSEPTLPSLIIVLDFLVVHLRPLTAPMLQVCLTS